GSPFYAGTYYPPEPRRGMPSFRQVLQAVQQAWNERRSDVTEAASQIAAQLGAAVRLPAGDRPPSADQLDSAATVLAAEFDAVAAGFGGAPKFPPSMVLEFLLRQHGRTGDPQLLSMAGS